MADFPDSELRKELHPDSAAARAELSSYSIHELVDMFRRRRGFLSATIGGLLLLCLLYCLIAPNQYEASARVALRLQPTSSLTLDAGETIAPASILSTPLQLETLADVLRSERLSWRVLTELKLYQSSSFNRRFPKKFPGFDPAKPTAEAKGTLLETFGKRLQVRTLPRTLLIEIRFRSRDPVQAASVVNALIQAFLAEEEQNRCRDENGR